MANDVVANDVVEKDLSSWETLRGPTTLTVAYESNNEGV